MIERYTLPKMGKIWQDENKFCKWLEVEILACEALAKTSQLPPSALKEIKKKLLALDYVKNELKEWNK